jgi:hypothetical protein
MKRNKDIERFSRDDEWKTDRFYPQWQGDPLKRKRKFHSNIAGQGEHIWWDFNGLRSKKEARQWGWGE